MMYESIQSTPDMLAQCLEAPIRGQIEAAARAIKEHGTQRVILIGCGTSMLSGQCCAQFFTEYTDVATVADSAFELLHYPSQTVKVRPTDTVLAFSHSGGVKAVVDYITICREAGALTIGITDVENSPIAGAAQIRILGPGGKDSPIPKTRSFSSGLFIGLQLVMCYAEQMGKKIDWSEVNKLPQQAKAVLSQCDKPMRQLAEDWKNANKFYYLGSGTNYFTAREGALKLMEAANVNVMGIQIEELTHGMALPVNDQYRVVLFLPKDCKASDRLFHVVKGMANLKAEMLLVCNDPATESKMPKGAGRVLAIEETTSELLSIFLFILPMQLLAYYSTVGRGLHPDNVSIIRPDMQAAVREFHPPGYH